MQLLKQHPPWAKGFWPGASSYPKGNTEDALLTSLLSISACHTEMPPWYITPFQHWKILINFLKSYYGFLYWCSILYLHCFRSFPPPLPQSILTTLHHVLHSLSTCTPGFAIHQHTEQDENTPGGLNSPKLHWRDCLASFLQASVLPAALLQGPKAWSLGESITCCHQASFTGWNKMRLFTVRASEKTLSPFSYEHSTGK